MHREYLAVVAEKRYLRRDQAISPNNPIGRSFWQSIYNRFRPVLAEKSRYN